MNQAAAKAERRSIRRAFGPEAVELLQRQTEAANFCTATVSAVSERIEGLGLRVSQLETRVERMPVICEDRAIANGYAHAELLLASEPLRRSFLGRLRWLLTGK